MGVKFIFIISLMHALSDKVRFVQRKLKPEEAFTTKKWMVLAKHLLAQAHMYNSNRHYAISVHADMQYKFYKCKENVQKLRGIWNLFNNSAPLFIFLLTYNEKNAL